MLRATLDVPALPGMGVEVVLVIGVVVTVPEVGHLVTCTHLPAAVISCTSDVPPPAAIWVNRSPAGEVIVALLMLVAVGYGLNSAVYTFPSLPKARYRSAVAPEPSWSDGSAPWRSRIVTPAGTPGNGSQAEGE